MDISKYPLNKLKERIEFSNFILITTHVNPDGDAIGASLALMNILKEANKNVALITPNEMSFFLKWMKSADEVIDYEKQKVHSEEIIAKADLIFYVDFNDTGRLGKAQKSFNSSSAYKVLIDHHPDPDDSADLIISETSSGSAAELVYELIKNLSYSKLMNKDIAECIYAGIMTDTGNFSFACSYPEVWKNMAELIEYGIDKNRVSANIYDNYSESRMRLMGFCLNEKMKIIPEFNSSCICLSLKEMEDHNHQPGDTEGFVNLPFSISGIKFSALLLEKESNIKLSLRSRGDFDVNEMARKHFKGGGHTNAAGGELSKPIENAMERLIEVLKEYKEDLQ